MVHDREGDVVATNVTRTRHGVIYLVLIGEQVIGQVEKLFDDEYVLTEIDYRASIPGLPDELDEHYVPRYYLSRRV